MEDIDGIHHINIYSKGTTEIGRWLSNFSECSIEVVEGNFKSVEGYWYWLSTYNDHLRNLHGFSAKKLGKESKKMNDIEPVAFRKKICDAIDFKLKTRARDVANINLPLQHYYDYGGKRVYKKEYDWITEHIEIRIKQLKEYYEKQKNK